MFDSHHGCQVYTTHQVAQIFQVTIPTVVNWTKRGLLVFHRTAGGHRRIRYDSILAFSQEQKVPTPEGFAGNQGPVRVLLIDASKEFLETWKEYFPKDTVALKLVHDPLSAGLAIARFKPNVVVVHIGMAGIVVDEFVKHVSEVSSGQVTHVLALSDYISPAVEEQLSASGFVAVMQKPVRLSDATKVVTGYFS